MTEYKQVTPAYEVFLDRIHYLAVTYNDKTGEYYCENSSHLEKNVYKILYSGAFTEIKEGELEKFLPKYFRVEDEQIIEVDKNKIDFVKKV